MIHRLPKTTNPLRQKWLQNIEKHQHFSENDEKKLSFRVCREHFEESMVWESSGMLKKDAYPTCFPSNIEIPSEDLVFEPYEIQSTKVQSSVQSCRNEW